VAPDDALAFVCDLQKRLPDGWGFISFEDDEGVSNLVVTETEPPLPAGWLVWLAKNLLGGRILKGAVYFKDDDRPEDVESRAWVVLELLKQQERRDAARWN
jgi:hypothetical protein